MLLPAGAYKRERVILFPNVACLDRLKHDEVLSSNHLNMRIVHELKLTEQQIMDTIREAHDSQRLIALMFAIEQGAHINIQTPMGAHLARM